MPSSYQHWTSLNNVCFNYYFSSTRFFYNARIYVHFNVTDHFIFNRGISDYMQACILCISRFINFYRSVYFYQIISLKFYVFYYFHLERPLGIPDENGCILSDADGETNIDVRNSFSIPITVIDSGKVCNIFFAFLLLAEKRLLSKFSIIFIA